MKYLLAVDQSTSGTKAALFDENMRCLKIQRKEHKQYYPSTGWAEHDAVEIWENTKALLVSVSSGIDKKEIAGIGLANQRETTALWNRANGEPVCKAVVWQDVRAKYITDPLQKYADRISRLSGLKPSPYYSAAKAASVLAENAELKSRAQTGEICFGTIDSYLLYRLTGGRSFCTDITNACRTQLLDIKTLQWSHELAGYFEIPESMLAEKVLPADSIFGVVTSIPELEGIPIVAMLGDSHASLFGHGCTEPGMVKTSYGTGSSLMMNIGKKPMWSQNGLSTSVGFACGGKVNYVLEGNITCSADTLIWVRDSLKLISSMDELEEAKSVPSADGVYLVPAFSGLGAPIFDENAKAVLFGMNRGTQKAHVLRAALASIAHQNADVLDAMARDTGIPVTKIRADGGGCVNSLLMQMQSDYVPCEVFVSAEKELTLRGIALMAGVSAGLFTDGEFDAPVISSYAPEMDETTRVKERAGWADAVRRCR